MSLAAMANVSMVVVLFFLIFAILGVQVGAARGGAGDAGVARMRLCTHAHLRPPLRPPNPMRQLFAGKFWSCNDTSVPDRAACVGSFLSPDTGEVRLAGG